MTTTCLSSLGSRIWICRTCLSVRVSGVESVLDIVFKPDSLRMSLKLREKCLKVSKIESISEQFSL